jgi:exopolysaccharide biosynthesis polyprenyl glycosylphosphotransferase
MTTAGDVVAHLHPRHQPLEEAAPGATRPDTQARPHPGVAVAVEPWTLAGLDLLALSVADLLTTTSALTAVVFALAVLIGLYRGRCYDVKLSPFLLDQVGPLVTRPLVAGGGVALVLLVLGRQPAGLLALTLAGTAAIVLARAVGYRLVRTMRRSGATQRDALVVGADQVGRSLAQALRDRPVHGLRPVGLVDEAPATGSPDLPVLGGPAELERLLDRTGAEAVVIAFLAASRSSSVRDLVAAAGPRREVLLVPRYYEVCNPIGDVNQVQGIPLVRLAAPRLWGGAGRHLKRGIDVMLASLGLVLLSPVLAACAVAVRMEGGPGVLFRQTRIGMHGRPFELLKFRSMRPGDEIESQTAWSIEGDPRIGPVGRFLRRSSLDELPQLINVVDGDMSLVGPRPERPLFVQRYSDEVPGYGGRHRAPVGLSGWAQVHGLRGDTSIEERARLDNYYIDNWSLGRDLKILVLSVLAVVRQRVR